MTSPLDDILSLLRTRGNVANRDGMARFGIDISRACGVKIPEIRKIARFYRNNHPLALELWATEIHEARILATMIDEPAQVSPQQMNAWTTDFNSWDLCDQCCINLFVHTAYVFEKIREWSGREPEFEKRAAFALLAAAAVHQKKEKDKTFIEFLPVISEAAVDERNFVKKAVNWSLRQIGKRNANLNHQAIQLAMELAGKENSKSSRWIGKDALRELQNKSFA